MADKNLLQLVGAGKSFGARVIFEDAQVSLNEGEHLGVIGPNGAGKTTLLRVIAGQEELDRGRIVKAQGLRIGYLTQHDTVGMHAIVEAFLTEQDVTPIWDLCQLGEDLGIGQDKFQMPISSLSGGYRMRVRLLRLLAERPDLLMLDEPTNYLDLESILALERFLQGYAGTFLLVSHDREFLRRTTDHTLEVEQGEINKFPGTIDDYFDFKEQMRVQQLSQAASLAARRAAIEDFANRFRAKASKARQVQSRLKELGRMESIEIKSLPVSASIRIPQPSPSGKLSFRIEGGVAGYADKKVLDRISIEVLRGDHVAVVGLNGAGKSTLLKSIAGILPLQGGTRTLGHEVAISYYAQHVGEGLLPEETVRQALSRAASRETKDQDILDLAGSLLFSGADVEKRIKGLSGGEKARVALGQILLQKSSLLVLDEPTNHLDFYTVEALTQALTAYAGTFVVVSHDQGFVRRIATKILEVRDGSAEVYPGTYEDYVWSLTRGLLRTRDTDKPGPAGSPRGQASSVSGKTGEGQQKKAESSVEWKAQKVSQNRRRQIDRRLPQIEGRLEELRVALEAANESITRGNSGPAAVAELAALQSESDELEAEWLNLMEEKDSAVDGGTNSKPPAQ